MVAMVEFPFVLELLYPKKFVVRKMFGCTALYLGEKIMLIFRLKKDHAEDNGVWIATTPDYHESLAKDFPSMRSIRLFGKGPTTWQNLPLEAADFESSVEKLCDFVKKGDSRIGKVPDSKKKKGGKKQALKRPIRKKKPVAKIPLKKRKSSRR
jgi:hypothetical protein